MGRLGLGFAVGWLVLAACGPTGSTTSNPTVKLTLAYHAGQSFTWRVNAQISGKQSVAGSTPTGGQVSQATPIVGTVAGTLKVSITSVDTAGDGIGTVTLSGLHATFNGSSTSLSGPGQSERVKLTPTGQFEPLVQGGPCAPAGFPGAGLGTFSPDVLLPAQPVKPGDSWTQTGALPLPAMGPPVNVTFVSRFLRYQDLAGSRNAVVATSASSHFNTEFGPPGGCLPELPAPRLTVHLVGAVTSTSTTWVDVASHLLTKARANVREQVSIAVPHPSGQPGPARPAKVTLLMNLRLTVQRTA